MKPHLNLEVWKKSMSFVTKIYKITSIFPETEKYGLVNQMRRAAVSIPSNIAEGAARAGRKEFGNFLSIAQGSIAELETQLIISKNLGYSDSETFKNVLNELDEISRMIMGLKKSLKNL